MATPVARWRVVNGEVQTTDHRPDGQWMPAACPLSHHDTAGHTLSPHHCYVDSGCPFLSMYDKAGKVYVAWSCGYQPIEHEVESVTWD